MGGQHARLPERGEEHIRVERFVTQTRRVALSKYQDNGKERGLAGVGGLGRGVCLGEAGEGGAGAVFWRACAWMEAPCTFIPVATCMKSVA